MKKHTEMALQDTIDHMKSTEEFRSQKVNGEWIVGPMKWIVLILGPNHQAKSLESLLNEEYKNLNIIIVLVTHNR